MKRLLLVAAVLMSACAGADPADPADDAATDRKTAFAKLADDRPWRTALAEDGLAAAEANLSAAETSAETDFLLGGVRFLSAFETIMQIRYQNYSGSLAILPGMRNQLPENPGGAFDPAFVERAMTEALEDLAAAETVLEGAVGRDFAAEIDLTSIWFDIDSDGERAEWESLLYIMSDLGGAPESDEAGAAFDGLVRFDTADADWLKAYVHVVSAMAELTLSVDPTPAIETVSSGRAKLRSFGETARLGFMEDEDVWIDAFAAVLTALRGTPDAERTRAAHGHFLKMIRHNRDFWRLVAEETDNEREWLPNVSQTSFLGQTVNEDTAATWAEVLTEMEAMLNGEKLIPYWQVNPEASVGVNLKKLFEEPGDMDPILWIQGAGAAPYLEQGELVDPAVFRRFGRMTRGDTLLFAIWFN